MSRFYPTRGAPAGFNPTRINEASCCSGPITWRDRRSRRLPICSLITLGKALTYRCQVGHVSHRRGETDLVFGMVLIVDNLLKIFLIFAESTRVLVPQSSRRISRRWASLNFAQSGYQLILTLLRARACSARAKPKARSTWSHRQPSKPSSRAFSCLTTSSPNEMKQTDEMARQIRICGQPSLTARRAAHASKFGYSHHFALDLEPNRT